MRPVRAISSAEAGYFFCKMGQGQDSRPCKMQGGEIHQDTSQMMEAIRPVWPSRR